jgi:hypothetical protein
MQLYAALDGFEEFTDYFISLWDFDAHALVVFAVDYWVGFPVVVVNVLGDVFSFDDALLAERFKIEIRGGVLKAAFCVISKIIYDIQLVVAGKSRIDGIKEKDNLAYGGKYNDDGLIGYYKDIIRFIGLRKGSGRWDKEVVISSDMLWRRYFDSWRAMDCRWN